MSTHELDAEIRPGRGGGAYVEIPFDVVDVFGTRSRVKVQVRFEGMPYRGSIAPYGGMHILGVPKAIREALGKSIGDTIRVVLEEDAAPRVVTPPEELARALDANPQAAAAFQGLSYSHQREYAQWVAQAKREETRLRRAEQAVERLSRGETLR